jgi:hypothetical protein
MGGERSGEGGRVAASWPVGEREKEGRGSSLGGKGTPRGGGEVWHGTKEGGGSGGQHRPDTDGDGRRESRGSTGGRRGGWAVGQPMGWGPTGDGKGGYDKWARAGERKERKKKTDSIQI